MLFIRVIPKENYFNKCPVDVIKVIFSFLNDLSLIRVTVTHKRFHNLMLKERSEIVYKNWKVSHPNVYQIPDGIIAGFDFTECTDYYTAILHREFGNLHEDEVGTALEYLQEWKVPLKRGDIVQLLNIDDFRNWGVHIFNGKTLIPLDRDIDETNGTVPREFKVIDEFPIEYFHRNCFNSGRRGVRKNYIVWFNQWPYLDQLLNNIKVDKNILKSRGEESISEIMYTFFTHKNGKMYYIIPTFDCFEMTRELFANNISRTLKENAKDEFISLLSSDTYFESHYYTKYRFKDNIEILFIDKKSKKK